MSQPPFLTRNRWDKQLVQADEIRFSFAKVYKTAERSHGFDVQENTGKVDKSKIDLRPVNNRAEGKRALRPDGRGALTNWVERIGRSAAEVKQVVRRLRPEEAALLDDLDQQIETLQQSIASLRAVRAEVVKTAWQRAHVVTLKDVEEMVR